MSQQDIYLLLKKNKQWMSTKEIAKKIGIRASTTSTNLKKMRLNGEIKVKKGYDPYKTYLYKLKLK